MKRRYFLGLAVLLAVPARAKQSAAWYRHQDKNGRFSANFPTAPKQKQQQDSSPIGQVVTTIVTAQGLGGEFTVTYCDLPAAATMFGTGEVFENAKTSLLNDAGGNQVSWTNISQYGPGKELRYEMVKRIGVCQIYLVGQRLYVADVKVQNTKANAAINTFFANFVIQK